MNRGRITRLLPGVAAFILAAAVGPPAIDAQENARASEGMVAYRSNASFAATLERVESAVKERGLFLMNVLDHSGSAAKFGRELNPNSVVLFGNPQVGSQIMTCEPRAGIDLPQKLLLWEEDGQVNVAYNSPEYLTQRHSVEGCGELLARVAETLDAIARKVAGKE
ncbi:MAG: DUF302 domain-containing protein [Gemmatimonadota bacterium]